jgi:hypothetical protein
LSDNNLINQNSWSTFAKEKFHDCSSFIKKVNRLKIDVPEGIVWTQKYGSYFKKIKGEKFSYKLKDWVVKLFNGLDPVKENTKILALTTKWFQATLKPTGKKEISPKGKGEGATKGTPKKRTDKRGKNPREAVPSALPEGQIPLTPILGQVPTYSSVAQQGAQLRQMCSMLQSMLGGMGM